MTSLQISTALQPRRVLSVSSGGGPSLAPLAFFSLHFWAKAALESVLL
jgi:hypothetical protein